MKPQPYPLEGRPGFWNASGRVGGRIAISDAELARLHRYAVGDRLWVRERAHIDGRDVNFAADCDPGRDLAGLGYRPSIFLPRWASRLTLHVTDVRVQRLQDISREDAVAEGCPSEMRNRSLGWFSDLWCQLNDPDAWAANPWIAAISFEVERANIDAARLEASA